MSTFQLILGLAGSFIMGLFVGILVLAIVSMGRSDDGEE
jgi:hypothetical protein